MAFNPSGTWTERRCDVWQCKANAIRPGKFCQRHRHLLMVHGSADTGPLDPKLRRLFIDAVMRRVWPARQRTGKRLSRAKPLKLSQYQKKNVQSAIRDMSNRLSSLPYAESFNCLGGRVPAQIKAEQALSWIVKQQGLEKASKLILAVAVGTEICPKENSSERYKISQVARAVIGLVKVETVKNWIGKDVVKHWSWRGWYMKKKLYEIIDPSCWVWRKEIEDAVLEELRLDTQKRTLELNGATPRSIERFMDEKKKKKAQNRLAVEPVKYPMEDGSCRICFEKGETFCGQHGDAQARGLREQRHDTKLSLAATAGQDTSQHHDRPSGGTAQGDMSAEARRARSQAIRQALEDEGRAIDVEYKIKERLDEP